MLKVQMESSKQILFYLHWFQQLHEYSCQWILFHPSLYHLNLSNLWECWWIYFILTFIIIYFLENELYFGGLSRKINNALHNKNAYNLTNRLKMQVLIQSKLKAGASFLILFINIFTENSNVSKMIEYKWVCSE